MAQVCALPLEPSTRLPSQEKPATGRSFGIGLAAPAVVLATATICALFGLKCVDYMGTDACIERAARVSYGYGTRKNNLTRGLIRYLRRHHHTTPSEMVELKFHCCMPMFIARQWIRHRTANVNEYSARYSILDNEFYLPRPEHLAAQSKANRQGRDQVIGGKEAERVFGLLKKDAELV